MNPWNSYWALAIVRMIEYHMRQRKNSEASGFDHPLLHWLSYQTRQEQVRGDYGGNCSTVKWRVQMNVVLLVLRTQMMDERIWFFFFALCGLLGLMLSRTFWGSLSTFTYIAELFLRSIIKCAIGCVCSELFNSWNVSLKILAWWCASVN